METNMCNWEINKNIFKLFQKIAFVSSFIFTVIPFGCTKFVQVDPPTTAITSATVFSDDLSAASAVTSIYINMMSYDGLLTSGGASISTLAGLTADELKNYSSDPTESQCYTNSMVSTNPHFWQELYNEIHVTNSVLDGLANSSGVSVPEKQQLNGEAKFMRAFLHFYGTNLFGDIPLVTTANYLTNNSISRSPQTEVYKQIIADLLDAQKLLSDNFVTPIGGNITTERVRPNKWAATALLARTYLYTDSFFNAETQSSLVISNTSMFNLDTLNGVFLANSNEAIWQMQPVQPGYNTFDGYHYILTSNPGSSMFPVALSTNLVQAFEPGDKRDSNWVGTYTSDSINYYYFPFKYKIGPPNANNPVQEYAMVLRLAEQYLIRAEARAQQNNLIGAASDLNIIRTRAGLPPTTAVNQVDLLNAINHERQVELFTEWGHRWFDLKRTGNVNSIMTVVTPQKGGSWSPNWALFPIPQSEIVINANLTQNPGY